MKKEVKELKEGFENKMVATKEDEAKEEEIEDTEKGEEIITGEQTIYIKGYGTLIFRFPDTGMFLEGDKIYSRYKSEHLRKGDVMTEAQLKAIYNQPVKIMIDGKEIVVGDGEWPEKLEHRLYDELPEVLKIKSTEFEFLRERAQALKGVKGKEKEFEKVNTNAYNVYQEINKLKIERLELQSKRMILFASSLEEQGTVEKLKLFAPSCILKEDGSPLWSSSEEFMRDEATALRVMNLYRFFLSGSSIDFFSDTPPVKET